MSKEKLTQLAIALSVAIANPSVVDAEQVPTRFPCSRSTQLEVVRSDPQPEELVYFRSRFAQEINVSIDPKFFDKVLLDPSNSDLQWSYQKKVRDCPNPAYSGIEIIESINYTIYKKDYFNPTARFEEGSTANGLKYRSMDILVDPAGVNLQSQPTNRYSNEQLADMAKWVLAKPVNGWVATDSRAAFDNRLSYDDTNDVREHRDRAFSNGSFSIVEEFKQ